LTDLPYSILADLVLVTHTLVVFFIVGGLALVLLGAALGWAWIRYYWFRMAHLAAIAVVALQSWLEIFCPLTTLEMYLRNQAGQAAYSESFIAHWLHGLLYYEAPFWVFSLCYTLFGLTVLAAWVLIPPRRPRRGKGQADK